MTEQGVGLADQRAPGQARPERRAGQAQPPALLPTLNLGHLIHGRTQALRQEENPRAGHLRWRAAASGTRCR